MPRKQKKYHFIYKTTCLINNKYYYGMHSTDNLNDGYLGSGKRLWYSLNKYGRENHKIEMLEFFDTRENLKNREIEIVNYTLLKDPLCMNLSLGGNGSWYCANSNSALQKIKSKKANEKRKWLFENDKKWVKNVKLSISNGVKDSLKNHNHWIGKKHKKDTTEKMSKTHKGKHTNEKNCNFGNVWIYNINLKQSKSIKKEELDIWINNNWIKGRKFKF